MSRGYWIRCPRCGAETEQATGWGGPDPERDWNEARCASCGWKGRVDECLPEKEAKG